jgi:hypothetical protein
LNDLLHVREGEKVEFSRFTGELHQAEADRRALHFDFERVKSKHAAEVQKRTAETQDPIAALNSGFDD